LDEETIEKIELVSDSMPMSMQDEADYYVSNPQSNNNPRPKAKVQANIIVIEDKKDQHVS